MTVISELLRGETDGGLSFGDYSLNTKTKLDDFEFQGDIYKVKTFREITKLERNGMFVFESVPGTAVLDFKTEEEEMSFTIYGAEGSAQFTVELEEETTYEVFLDDISAGDVTTNLSGKLSASVELKENAGVRVKIVKR